jgi:hypothetical protein
VVNNDRDVDGIIDPNSVTIVAGSGPTHGTWTMANGVVTYTPNANFSGADSFQYTVKDNDGFVSQPATVSITVQEVPDYQNPLLNADVNKSGTVTPLDALIDINYINGPAGGVLPPDPIPPATPDFYYDVNGNGVCDAGDVLAIVNILNRSSGSAAGGEGEAVRTGGERQAETTPLASDPLGAPLLAVPDYTLLARATGGAAMAVPATRHEASAAAGRSEPVPAAAQTLADVEDSGQDAWFQRIGSESSELLDAAWDAGLDDFAGDVEDGFGELLAADVVLSGLKAKA